MDSSDHQLHKENRALRAQLLATQLLLLRTQTALYDAHRRIGSLAAEFALRPSCAPLHETDSLPAMLRKQAQ